MAGIIQRLQHLLNNNNIDKVSKLIATILFIELSLCICDSTAIGCSCTGGGLSVVQCDYDRLSLVRKAWAGGCQAA